MSLIYVLLVRQMDRRNEYETKLSQGKAKKWQFENLKYLLCRVVAYYKIYLFKKLYFNLILFLYLC